MLLSCAPSRVTTEKKKEGQEGTSGVVADRKDPIFRVMRLSEKSSILIYPRRVH